jgi:hypothetical protein
VSRERTGDEGGVGLPTREELLARAKPFPRYEEMVIEGLTDEEEKVFLDAIAQA